MENHEKLIKFLKEKRGMKITGWFYGVGFISPGKLALVIDIDTEGKHFLFSKRYFIQREINHLATHFFNVKFDITHIFWKNENNDKVLDY